MEESETAFEAPPRARDEPVVDIRERYSSSDFLRQAGLTIAICLGLAMMAEMLVALI